MSNRAGDVGAKFMEAFNEMIQLEPEELFAVTVAFKSFIDKDRSLVNNMYLTSLATISSLILLARQEESVEIEYVPE